MADERTPDRDALSRRRFFGQVGTCTLGAAFLAGCESAELYKVQGLTADAPFNTTTHPGIAKVGGMAKLKGEGATLVLVRKDDKTVLAFAAICPHQFCEMTPGSAGGVGAWDDKNSELICMCHQSRFKEDGSFVDGSTLGGWDNPKPVAVYKVNFDKATGAGKVKAG